MQSLSLFLLFLFHFYVKNVHLSCHSVFGKKMCIHEYVCSISISMVLFLHWYRISNVYCDVMSVLTVLSSPYRALLGRERLS